MIYVLLLALASYLIGAIPFGYLLVRFRKGIDIRTVGSGSLGATNVSRVLGGRWFAVTFALDFAKGFVPAFVLGRLAVRVFDAPAEIGILYGILAMAGHIWPVYLGFKGGKGVATAAGAVTGIAPAATGLAAIVFLAVFLAYRYVSLGSICAAVALPVAYVALGVLGGTDPVDSKLAALVVMSALIVVKHRSNLKRLLAGTESRAGRPKPEEG